ncbi:MAG: polysaccharide pyruvyl transferase CsaB [candidate division WS1 bacterium]|jgi:polysaccharide pyruvyl transferase CsaB|nr:polysaccharide pyruvyl transferase CsaB [candidate division WS1 bacterium]
MRVLISGYYGFDNLGDEAILAALVQEMGTRHPDWTPVVLSDKPATTESAYGVPAVSRDSLLQLWEEMGRADLLISGGGGLLQNVTSQLSLFYYLSILELARWRGTPYVILGQGLGPFLPFPGVKRSVRRALEAARAVVVRDAESLRLAQSLGVSPARASQAADLALLLKPAAPEIGEKLLSAWGVQRGEPVVGLTMRGWGSKEPWEAAVELCDHLAGVLGVRALLLPFQPEDRTLAWRIAAACEHEPLVLQTSLLPAEMLSLISRLELLVSMRLHGLILAAAQETPAVGLAYDPKVYAFAQEAGQRVLPLEQVTGQRLRIVVEEVWQAREASKGSHADAAKRLRQAAERNFTVLEEVAASLGMDEGRPVAQEIVEG